MIRIKDVEVSCDGRDGQCGEVHPTSALSESAARAAVKALGWSVVRIYNRVLEFCPKCQQEAPQKLQVSRPKKAKVKTAEAK